MQIVFVKCIKQILQRLVNPYRKQDAAPTTEVEFAIVFQNISIFNHADFDVQ
jgi:hypothetical protein